MTLLFLGLEGLGASQIENKFSFFRESKDKPELRSGFFTEHLCSHFKKNIFHLTLSVLNIYFFQSYSYFIFYKKDLCYAEAFQSKFFTTHT